MSDYTKDDYLSMSRARVRALKAIADNLGKDHAITKMLDCLAWGRSEVEPSGVPSTLRSACIELGYLNGVFHVINVWARDNDTKAQRMMLDLFPRGFQRKEPNQ